MRVLRHLIISALLIAITVTSAHAQSGHLKINYDFAQQPQRTAAALHPAAKGALIGGAVGAGFWGGVGIWYCTIGPNEVGECSNTGQWARGMLLWGAVGAGIGALIGAIR